VAAAKPAAVDSRTFTGGGGQFFCTGRNIWDSLGGGLGGAADKQTGNRQTERTNGQTEGHRLKPPLTL